MKSAMMREEERNVLQKNRPYLMQELNLDEMMGELSEMGILLTEDQDEIASKETRVKKNEVLLNCLPHRDPEAFSRFMIILRRKAAHIAQRLDKTQQVLAVCEDLKKKLKEREPWVLNVWPASVPNEDNTLPEVPVIAVNMEGTSLQQPLIEYRGYEVRCIDVSTVSSEVSLFTSCDRTLSPEEDNHLGDIISRHVDRLFEAHSNMTMAMPSPIRIQKGKTVPGKCIMLFCKAKGFVPYCEELFPIAIEDVPVDVVEGVAFLGNHRHSQLHIGCSIAHEKETVSYGTLGGFVQDRDGNLGVLTCYHCLTYPSSESNMSIGEQELSDENTEVTPQYGDTIVHPSNSFDNQGEACGVFQRGTVDNHEYDCTEYFVDAAFVHIKNHNPNDGNLCPDKKARGDFRKLGLKQELTFNKVHECAPDDVPDYGHVYKFGQTTGLTNGQLLTSRTFTRFEEHEIDYKSPIGKKIAKNLFAVKNLRRHNVFFQAGDSGALVFFVSEEAPTEPRIIGMCVAHAENALTLATPIKPVLATLDLRLANFLE